MDPPKIHYRKELDKRNPPCMLNARGLDPKPAKTQGSIFEKNSASLESTNFLHHDGIFSDESVVCLRCLYNVEEVGEVGIGMVIKI